MILRLIIAAARWVWGVSPAFYSTPNPPTDGDKFVMAIGAFIDIFALLFVPVVAGVIAAAIRDLREGRGEERTRCDASPHDKKGEHR